MAPKNVHLLLLATLFARVCIVSPTFGQSNNFVSVRSNAQIAPPPFVREPTGASRCQFCHPSEVEGYARSAMAHSLRSAGEEPKRTVTTLDAITMYLSPTGAWPAGFCVSTFHRQPRRRSHGRRQTLPSGY